ncbi:MAG: hypothetical protein JSU68_00970 [Phycisphaerales bacterium]|nr:MAG: hypothetical protein JSU68_00970 [Phycisphaerales bacterium]
MNTLIHLLVTTPFVFAGPPQAGPVSKSWNLEFQYADPQRITVGLPGRERPQTFWYLLYTVTNNSGQEVDFYPRFAILTGSGHELQSERGVSPLVFEAIKKRHAKTHPFLQKHSEIIGRLLQTPDQAKDGVAVWPEFSVLSSKFTIYVAGLSGDFVEVPNPGYKEDQPQRVEEKLADGITIPRVVNPRQFTLHRTLAIHYDLPGDAQTRTRAEPVRTGQEWVMR